MAVNNLVGYRPKNYLSQNIAPIGENLLTKYLLSGEMIYGTVSSTEAIEIVFLFRGRYFIS